MSDHFLPSLALTLEAETGYHQPVGGPYVRLGLNPKHGDPRETGKPDGLAYDDNPNDTGGRTCMGILQREYTAWRKRQGLPSQDVWLIGDDELQSIYRVQYWDACQCERMPAGVDFAIFDSAVNCGVGMGAKFLQRALGVTVDGHIGVATLAALAEAQPAELIHGIIAARIEYHRACKTFWRFGKGWLDRDAATEHEALTLLPVAIDNGHAPAYGLIAQDSARATPPPPVETVADTSTGQSAVVNGSTAGGITLASAVTLYSQAQSQGLFSPEHLVPIAVIIGGITIIACSRRDWIDRGRKLIMGV